MTGTHSAFHPHGTPPAPRKPPGISKDPVRASTARTKRRDETTQQLVEQTLAKVVPWTMYVGSPMAGYAISPHRVRALVSAWLQSRIAHGKNVPAGEVYVVPSRMAGVDAVITGIVSARQADQQEMLGSLGNFIQGGMTRLNVLLCFPSEGSAAMR